MKKYARVFRYISQYKSDAFLYILFIVLSIIFSLVSLGMLFPFLEMLFNGDKPGGSGFITSTDSKTVLYVRNLLVESIRTKGKDGTLAWICVFIIASIFLKNVFLYLAYRVLNPLKNKIVNRLRDELYEKILHLPIGFFTEKKKGDVISRMTNDVGEVEASVIGTLEGWVRDPLTILVNFAVLFYISPQITIAILLCIPVISFVLGRISRALKRQSNEAAIKYGESLSVLDETLDRSVPDARIGRTFAQPVQ